MKNQKRIIYFFTLSHLTLVYFKMHQQPQLDSKSDKINDYLRLRFRQQVSFVQDTLLLK